MHAKRMSVDELGLSRIGHENASPAEAPASSGARSLAATVRKSILRLVPATSPVP